MRIIFMGTAPLAAVSLEKLAAAREYQLVTVVTQPDRPKGRDLKLQPSAVKIVAQQFNLPVLQPLKARDPVFIDQLKGLEPDLIVVAAYGQILPQSILELPKYGCLNVHASLLPRWRGAAPIQWAILSDDPETGVTIMKMDAGLDTGDMITKVATPISPQDNAQTLHDRLAQIGSDLLLATIPQYVNNLVQPSRQPLEGMTYARKIEKEDGHLDWHQPARAVWNRVRAFTPWPGAYTYLVTNEKRQFLKIWEAEIIACEQPLPGVVLHTDKQGIVVGCGQDALRVKVLQREGSKQLTAQQFLAGYPLKSGWQF